MNNLIQHAAVKMQGRCISLAAIDHLLGFGRWERCGTASSGKPRRDAKKVECYLGPDGSTVVSRAMGVALIVEEDRVVTTTHRNARIRRDDQRWWRGHQ